MIPASTTPEQASGSGGLKGELMGVYLELIDQIKLSLLLHSMSLSLHPSSLKAFLKGEKLFSS